MLAGQSGTRTAGICERALGCGIRPWRVNFPAAKLRSSTAVTAQVAAADTAGLWQEALGEVERFRAGGGRPNTIAYNALVRQIWLEAG